ncbi:hypothetical protein AAVH_08391 [Aphelenchoides avenae]|nr:hypothetical protein AAVH_08391 [Aphelenchus avenae]
MRSRPSFKISHLAAECQAQVIEAEKELRTNSCYRIIFVLCLSGFLNGIAFVPNSAIFLFDIVGLPSAEHMFGSVIMLSGYLRTPPDTLLSVNRLLLIVYRTNVGARLSALFDVLLVVSCFIAFGVLACLLSPLCEIRILLHVWDWSDCKLAPYIGKAHMGYLFPMLALTLLCYIVIVGMLAINRRNQQFQSFSASFEWSVLGISCVDFAQAAIVLILTHIFSVTYGGGGAIQLLVTVLHIYTCSTCPIFLLTVNRR